MAEKSKDNESARHISMPENKSESNKRFLSQHKTSERCYRLLIDNLGQIDRAIKQETDIEQMPRTVLETVFAIFECDRVWILYPCDPEAASYRVPMEVYRAGHPGAKALKLEVQMTPDKARTMKEALAFEKPLMHGNVTGTRGVKRRYRAVRR